MKSLTRHYRPATLGATLGLLAAVVLTAARGAPHAAGALEACEPIRIDRFLQVIEQEILPLTRQGVERGSKLFGAAVLRKSDYSLVLAATNNEVEGPLWHGEVQAIKSFYEMPAAQRPAAGETLFLTTHEPCPLCLSAITWGGYDNFYYLFSYEDSRDSFNIPHDIRIMQEVFRPKGGDYAHQNAFWTARSITKMIDACDEERRKEFAARVDGLKKTYDELSEVYQRSKATSTADIPLD